MPSPSPAARSRCYGTRGRFMSAYFLKTADPAAFNLVVVGCHSGVPNTFTTRMVTAEAPLSIAPAR